MLSANSGAERVEERNVSQTLLYRKEALDYLSQRHYGTVHISHPLSHKLLTICFAFIAALLIAFFLFFSVPRKVECQGILLPAAGALRITPLQGGTIVHAKVVGGQHVRAGEEMFVLSSDRSSTNTKSAEEAVTKLLEGRRDSFDAKTTPSIEFRDVSFRYADNEPFILENLCLTISALALLPRNGLNSGRSVFSLIRVEKLMAASPGRREAMTSRYGETM
ncbi:hypothetical protein ABT364_19770 [Massilia sp. SR12]